MGKQIKIEELTKSISTVIKKLYKGRDGAILSENNEYFSEFGINLGLERYTSDHNVTCSKLFAICDFLEISLSDFFKLVEEEDEKLKFNIDTKGELVKKAYKKILTTQKVIKNE